MCVLFLLTGLLAWAPPQPTMPPAHRFSWTFPRVLSFWHWCLMPFTSVPMLSTSTAPWPWLSLTLFTISPSYISSMRTWPCFPSHLRLTSITVLMQMCCINEAINEQNLYVSLVIMMYLSFSFSQEIFFFQNNFLKLIWQPHGEDCLSCQMTDRCVFVIAWEGVSDHCAVCVCLCVWIAMAH